MANGAQAVASGSFLICTLETEVGHLTLPGVWATTTSQALRAAPEFEFTNEMYSRLKELPGKGPSAPVPEDENL